MQPGSGSKGAQAHRRGGGTLTRWLGAHTAQAQVHSGEAGP